MIGISAFSKTTENLQLEAVLMGIHPIADENPTQRGSILGHGCRNASIDLRMPMRRWRRIDKYQLFCKSSTFVAR